jgi:glycosyltransferase involved in cell wall biosynthesis
MLFKLRRFPNIINMDGLEWKRTKWGMLARGWLFMNERLGCWLASTLIADHPEVAKRLFGLTPRKSITMIPYGADEISRADSALLKPWGLQPDGFALLVARIEPENSILEMVRAFSARVRHLPFVVVGPFDPEHNGYHAHIRTAASSEVLFLGPIYERETLAALRFFARLYLHGHTVGGTNPTLVEAMASGAPILAHANPFNRWVVGQGAVYFANEEECRAHLDRLLIDEDMLKSLGERARKRFLDQFLWSRILQAYEKLFCQFA